jgi:hypothetical protein
MKTVKDASSAHLYPNFGVYTRTKEILKLESLKFRRMIFAPFNNATKCKQTRWPCVLFSKLTMLGVWEDLTISTVYTLHEQTAIHSHCTLDVLRFGHHTVHEALYIQITFKNSERNTRFHRNQEFCNDYSVWLACWQIRNYLLAVTMSLNCRSYIIW